MKLVLRKLDLEYDLSQWSGLNVKEVSAGLDFFLALTEDGRMYGADVGGDFNDLYLVGLDDPW